MDAEDVRARVHPMGEGGQRARKTLARSRSGERPDEVLARDRHQQRQSQLVQAPDLGEQLDRLGGSLCEIRPWVDDELLGSHACGERQCDALAQEGEHLDRDVAVELRVLHAFAGRDPRVHDDERRPPSARKARPVRGPQATDIVDDLCPSGDRGARNRQLVGIHRDDRPRLAGDPLDERHDALDLLIHLDRRTAGGRGLSPDVQDVGPRREQLACQLDPRTQASRGDRRH